MKKTTKISFGSIESFAPKKDANTEVIKDVGSFGTFSKQETPQIVNEADVESVQTRTEQDLAPESTAGLYSIGIILSFYF